MSNEFCPICFGAGGAIGSGYEELNGEPCHAGPYVSKCSATVVRQKIARPRAELDPTKGACPKCGWPLDKDDDYNGDGFATCPCGVSVDLEAI